MSTRSLVGILNSDNSVDAVYCHFDGYLSGVGAMLADNYKDEAKIRKLLNLNRYLASIRKYVDKDDMPDPKDPNSDDITIVLDDDEPNNPYHYNTVKDYIDDHGNRDTEYCYLYKDNEWKVFYSNRWLSVANKL